MDDLVVAAVAGAVVAVPVCVLGIWLKERRALRKRRVHVLWLDDIEDPMAPTVAEINAGKNLRDLLP